MSQVHRRLLAAAVAVGLAAVLGGPARAQSDTAQVSLGSTDIGGIVTGPNGPEAGVWVIAETTDLPTRYSKIVVTDDQGRYLIPDLPAAGYQVWVRGYGLVDSARVAGTPGQALNLTARPAPSAAAAAEAYPGMYWYSMLRIPAADQFPGTGDAPGGNRISPQMRNQQAWVDTLLQSCQSCHALGSQNIRRPSPALGEFPHHVDLWQRRLLSGQAMTNMAISMDRFGAIRASEMFADWTDRISRGELPLSQPARPQGLERNMVVTLWDWASAQTYLHDAISTDKRNPTINANGLIYGSPEESTDDVPVLDPVTHRTWNIRHPVLDPATPSHAEEPVGVSPFWGERINWDGRTSNHNLIIDQGNRVWFAARIRPAATQPDWCRAGGDHPSARVAPLNVSGRQLSVYDQATQRFDLIDTCFQTHHLYLGYDADNTMWTSWGPPTGGAIGWLNTRRYLETRDARTSQGWAPMIVDVPGWGRRGEYTEGDQPLDPNRQRRVIASLYGVQPSPTDGSIWGQSMDIGFSRVDQRGYLVRFIPGEDPTHTGLAELFQPPPGAFSPRGIDVDSNGVVWTTLASGHLASFDRRRCTAPLTGPQAATGEHCFEGWTLHRFPGPQFEGRDPAGSANHAYYVWVDRFNTLGLGNDVPIASTNGGESLTVLVNGQMHQLRVPYPAGFFTKNVDGRIDDPNTGWRGRGVWTTTGTRTPYHSESGAGERPRVFRVQMRPDPLAR
ncbi:carboxypeptidase-like regulatory domain-containing protein [Plastoroseomonas arctica]|uniref:Carboxypeptidase regulatory-like domain-containing protein n=1 Tax=Plastoroseomonas arctica TaxID=1509237 RepID=A0AAF1K4Y0_9PROT|nr:carboxypeptidase-like regulatory domain-containing protein [Plastoroseomonas arctica]MBR0655805.1 carboxypeptidase regulatory-like domain-containing protein [Plastoroseomonas arctica]